MWTVKSGVESEIEENGKWRVDVDSRKWGVK